MTSSELAVLPTSSDENSWSPDQKALMTFVGAYQKKGQTYELAPRDIIMAFLNYASRSGLDPVAKQLYLICRGGRWGIQAGIDGFRAVASEYPDYDSSEPEWCGEDGVWVDVWPDIPINPEKLTDGFKPPMAARVKVYKQGRDRPFIGVAKWSEYAITGTGGDMWKKMPSNQLAKCAEAQALRKAYPQKFSGIYTADELGQDMTVIETRDWKAEALATKYVDDLARIREEMIAAGEYTQTIDADFRAHKAKLVAEEKLVNPAPVETTYSGEAAEDGALVPEKDVTDAD